MYRPTSAVIAVEIPKAGMKLSTMYRSMKVFAAIGKGIRRDIHNSHDQGSLTERERAPTQIPFEDRPHVPDSKCRLQASAPPCGDGRPRPSSRNEGEC